VLAVVVTTAAAGVANKRAVGRVVAKLWDDGGGWAPAFICTLKKSDWLALDRAKAPPP
jgi:hypothetical protein